MEQKKKKYYFIKFILLISVLTGIVFYSASFPVTMELLDKRINNILNVFEIENDFSLFSALSDFSKNVINKTEYCLGIIRDNIEKYEIETNPVSAIKITCAAKFPSKSNKITSEFGKREDPFSGKEDIHGGIDIAAAFGTEILAAWPGKISETGFDEIFGKYIVLEHSKGFFTKYCHLSKITVKENDFVLANDKIGEAGSTGRSTGSHLHFEVIVDGRKIDPMECFEV